MPPEIQRITEQFLSNPVRVEVSRPATAASTITQRLVASGSKDFEKRDVLRQILRDAADLKNAIIFCNRKKDIAVVVRSLERHGFNVGGLHGDMDQRARMAMLESFKAGRVPLLVASDVAARGLDIPDVSHVINYDVPIHAEDYVHRIGRTGRAGRTGTALSIVSKSDVKYLDAITALIKNKIEWDGVDLDNFVPAPSEGQDERPRRKERESRGRSGEASGRRSGRGNTTPADAASEKSVANTQARESAATVPQSQPTKPHHERRPRQDAPNPSRQEAPRPPRQSDAPASRSSHNPRYQRDEDDGPTVKGMGDSLPDFMRIPLRKPQKPT